jgi:putative ABC transport system ATP-binding protein
MSAEKIIRIEKIERDYIMGDETVRALRGVDLDIAKGEFVAIMGASGSGKTTLLNIMGCLDRPTSGDYFLDNENVKLMSKNALAAFRNKKIGFVFQSYNLLSRTTALENVELPLIYNRSIPHSVRKKKAKDALAMVGLSDRIYHTSAQMSGGQQQRVAIARALVNDPVIILADEATGNLDTKSSYEIMSIFQDLNEKGITIAFVTHESDISRFCKRIIRLKDGNIISDRINTSVASAHHLLEETIEKSKHEEAVHLEQL